MSDSQNFSSPGPQEQPQLELHDIDSVPRSNPLDKIDVVVGILAAAILAEIFLPLIPIAIFVAIGYSNHTIVGQSGLDHFLENPSAVFSLWLQFAFDIGLILPVLLLVKLRHHASLRIVGWKLPTSWQWYLVAPVIVVIAEVVSALVINFTTSLTHQSAVYQCLLIQKQYGNALFIAIPAVCIFAPIAEETVFRGFLFGWMQKVMPVWLAAGLSGLIFAFAHADMQLLIPLWIVGILLAYTYYYSRSLIPTMLTHALFNLVGIIAILKQTC